MEDILLDQALDLDFENGDFKTGKSTVQHQHLLLLSNKGDWRENPRVGVGLMGFLKDQDIQNAFGEIKEQFERDGMDVRQIAEIDNHLEIDASYI